MRKNWWKDFYDPQMGRELFTASSFETAEADIDCIVRRSGLKPGMRILDLACGVGRHSLELARRGYDVVGVDYSKNYIDRARQMARELRISDSVAFLRGDMRDISNIIAPQSFDAVISLWNSFGYFDTRREDRRVVQGVSRVLRPGGIFVLNTLNQSGVIFRLETVPRMIGLESLSLGTDDGEGRFWIDDARYLRKKKRTEARWTLIDVPSRKIRVDDFGQNVYSPAELDRIFKAFKMSTVRRWGTLTGAPYTNRSWHMTLVARKGVKKN